MESSPSAIPAPCYQREGSPPLTPSARHPARGAPPLATTIFPLRKPRKTGEAPPGQWSQDTGAGMARAWRGLEALFGLGCADVVRAWRGRGAHLACEPRSSRGASRPAPSPATRRPRPTGRVDINGF
eukprot:gene7220-biopygen22513